MLKRDELALPYSCLNRAADDEIVFVLLGRDVAAAHAIREWAAKRIVLGKNEPEDKQIVTALRDASAIEKQHVISPPARPHPEQVGPAWIDETGWLIERGGLCLGLNCGKPAWVTFTNDTAIRFARLSDGLNFLTAIRSMKYGESFDSCEVREHRWSGPIQKGSVK